MELVWLMTLRAMDDIKESVRQAGLALMRTVKSLTLRLIDPSLASPHGMPTTKVGLALCRRVMLSSVECIVVV